MIKFVIFAVIHQDPLELLHQPDRQVKWGCGKSHHPGVFRVFDGGSSVCNFPRDAACGLVHCRVGEEAVPGAGF